MLQIIKHFLGIMFFRRDPRDLKLTKYEGFKFLFLFSYLYSVLILANTCTFEDVMDIELYFAGKLLLVIFGSYIFLTIPALKLLILAFIERVLTLVFVNMTSQKYEHKNILFWNFMALVSIQLIFFGMFPNSTFWLFFCLAWFICVKLFILKKIFEVSIFDSIKLFIGYLLLAFFLILVATILCFTVGWTLLFLFSCCVEILGSVA